MSKDNSWCNITEEEIVKLLGKPIKNPQPIPPPIQRPILSSKEIQKMEELYPTKSIWSIIYNFFYSFFKEVDRCLLQSYIDKATKKEEQRRYKMSCDSKLVCPHCQTSGYIITDFTEVKRGIAGDKATAAVLTGGFSILFTGLSRCETMTEAHCSNCNSTWLF